MYCSNIHAPSNTEIKNTQFKLPNNWLGHGPMYTLMAATVVENMEMKIWRDDISKEMHKERKIPG